MAGGRTFTLIHKGRKLLVCEGMDGTVEFRMSKHRVKPKAKSFNAAVREATKYLLDYDGSVDESAYERETE